MGLALLAVIGLVFIGWQRRPAEVAIRNGVGLLLLLNPTLYPWYAQSLVGPMALAWRRGPSLWAVAALLALPTSYEVVDAYQAEGRWAPALWPILLLGVMVSAGLIADRLSKRVTVSVPRSDSESIGDEHAEVACE